MGDPPLPNVLFIHFAEMKCDMKGQMRRIAAFIGATIDESKWPEMVEQCSFD